MTYRAFGRDPPRHWGEAVELLRFSYQAVFLLRAYLNIGTWKSGRRFSRFSEVFQGLFRAVIPRIVVAREERLEAEALKDWMMLSATSFAKFAAPSQVPIRSSASEGRSFDSINRIFRRVAVDFLFFFQFCFFMPRYSVQNSCGHCP